MKKILYFSAYILLPLIFNISAQTISISVKDTIFNSINEDFYGIQYHSNTFNNQTALNKIAPLQLRYVRIWAEVGKFHPRPDVWEWEELDDKINEIIAAGYRPILCLWGEKWFVGTKGTAWWNYPEAVNEWEKAAFQLADRYKEKINMIIVFDELNMLKPEDDYYCSFKDAAKLFIKAAKQIKKAKPEMLCGGPSGPLGWENAHWADYVLQEPEGKENLDFISSNLFVSWNAEDSDSLIMNRTIWYEEVPQLIKKDVNGKDSLFILLDAYNASAVWQKDGNYWTDPRNTNLFGAVYQALALLHSAKGGFNITLRWEILGGFGIFNWYPDFKELPPYYSWKFIVETAALSAGAEIIGCNTSETPNFNAPHHSGMNVNSYKLQPFAIKRKDGGISVILINKDSNDTLSAKVKTPRDMGSYAIYQLNSNNIENCFAEIKNGIGDSVVNITALPLSVTVVRYTANSSAVKNGFNQPSRFLLYQNYPNPFPANDGTTTIKYSVPSVIARSSVEYGTTKQSAEFSAITNNSTDCHASLRSARNDNANVTLKVYDILGREVATLVNEEQAPGNYSVKFDASNLSSGIYFYTLRAGDFTAIKKMILMK